MNNATSVWHLLIGVTAILLIGSGITRLWPRTSAAQRHLVWSTVCWAVLLAPLLQWVTPKYELHILPTAAPALAATDDVPAARAHLLPRTPHMGHGVAGQRRLTAMQQTATLIPWIAVACTIWGMGTLIVLVPLLRSRRRVSRLGAEASPLVDRRTRRIFAEIAAEIGCRHRVELKEHPSAMPMVYGILRHVIVLPRQATTWSHERLRHVLLHEMAHITRSDALTQTVASLATAIYWFHPLVWIAARQLRCEREQACDDAVLAAGSCPAVYATDLLDLATTLPQFHVASLAALTFARSSHMHERLHAVLDTARCRTSVSQRTTVTTWSAAVSGIALTVGLTLHPRIVPTVGAQSGPVRQFPTLTPDSPVLARLKYNSVPSPEACQGSDTPVGGGGWGHDYPNSVEGLMKVFTAVTKSPTDSFAALTITDPTLEKYPIAMMTEPGCLSPTEAEVQALRTYLEKGGLLLVDDMTFFDCTPEHCQLAIERFEQWMERVLPKGRLVEVSASDPLFNGLFKIDPAKLGGFSSTGGKIMGIYRDNDPTKGLMVIAAYYSALGHRWRYIPDFPNGMTPGDAALQLGVNILSYGLSH